jgi:hypothetical protein
MADQVHHDLQAPQGLTTPILRDVAEHPVLDLIPLARTRWKVADRNRQADLIRKSLNSDLPQPSPTAVAPATIGNHQQFTRLRIVLRSDPQPPTTQRFGGDVGRIMINADTDPPSIGRLIRDPVRRRSKIT